jgi:hypothetical protein
MESAQKLNDNFSAAIADMMAKERERVNGVPQLETNNDTLSKYMYPTMIILPIVIVVILILASKAHIAIKIISILLLILVIFVYHLQQTNTDILKYIQNKPDDVSYKA